VFRDKVISSYTKNLKNKYTQESDVNQIRIHDFRHSYASLLVNKGTNVQL